MSVLIIWFDFNLSIANMEKIVFNIIAFLSIKKLQIRFDCIDLFQSWIVFKFWCLFLYCYIIQEKCC